VAFELKGKKEAGQLLVDGGTWAAKISDRELRRFALTTFASQLAGYDDLDEALAVMKNELDPAWRADTLAAIARNNIVTESRAPAVASWFRGAKSAGNLRFNKNVQYDENYRQPGLQQGMAPNSTEPAP